MKIGFKLSIINTYWIFRTEFQNIMVLNGTETMLMTVIWAHHTKHITLNKNDNNDWGYHLTNFKILINISLSYILCFVIFHLVWNFLFHYWTLHNSSLPHWQAIRLRSTVHKRQIEKEVFVFPDVNITHLNTNEVIIYESKKQIQQDRKMLLKINLTQEHENPDINFGIQPSLLRNARRARSFIGSVPFWERRRRKLF